MILLNLPVILVHMFISIFWNNTSDAQQWSQLVIYIFNLQVGQWDCKDRQKFLKDEYSFRCECSGCSELNVSDLVLNAFRCVNPDCFGTVLDSCVIKYENKKFERFQGVPQDCISEPHLQVFYFFSIETCEFLSDKRIILCKVDLV